MDLDDLVEMGRDEQGDSEKQEVAEKPAVQSPAVDSAPSSIPATPSQPWHYPTPDLSGAPVSSAIKAAYSRIADIYDAIPYLHTRCSEMRAAYQAALASPEFQAAEAAITAQFRAFQEAVKRTTPGPDHRAKAEAAKNMRAGGEWLVKFVGHQVKVASASSGETEGAK